MLASGLRKRGAVVIELAPEDYSYEMLSAALASEDQGSWAKVGAYAAAWKYLIYVLLMKELVAKSGGKYGRGPLAKIARYVRDNHSSSDISKLSALIGYLKRIEGVKIGPAEASFRTRELEKLYKLDEINALLPELKQVLAQQPAVIFVDELDRGWDASEDAQAFVAGMFQACMAMNSQSTDLTVYMSLRQELYDNIPALYDDAQKFRDVIETISWNEAGLMELIVARLRHSSPTLRDLPLNDAVWSSVFVETLTYRKSRSFNYLVDRTLYRPREFIQLCGDVIEEATSAGLAAPLDYQTITSAEYAYSEARTKDIASEYRFQYPGLLEVFEQFRGSVHLLDRESLEFTCLEAITQAEDSSVGVDGWLSSLEPEGLIQILWEVGFLRARALGGIKAERRSGSSYLGSHQVNRLNLDLIRNFQIHQMFRSYLGTREPKSTTPTVGQARAD
ncbi:hypothetical protein ASJ30_09515 [Janibacter indicus]|uniref:Uncharacterized protein n=1 Tax=Janibacter indicus TaxID=857417 RepID=A0A1L3MHA7_9MICO|nr:hypothetical protein ASJ30_09515 [Janibacter indicus]